MRICVCGWYYYPRIYKTLVHLSDRYDIMVIGNRPGDAMGLKQTLRENIGLDWGAFSYFLTNEWDGASSVLFIQDDIEVSINFFDEVAKIDHDQAFIFENERQYEREYSHGRAFFGSARFLAELVKAGGIWFDDGNVGFIAQGHSWTEKPPKGSMDHNAGVRDFTAKVKRIGESHTELAVNQQMYSSNVKLGRRGSLDPWV